MSVAVVAGEEVVEGKGSDDVLEWEEGLFKTSE